MASPRASFAPALACFAGLVACGHSAPPVVDPAVSPSLEVAADGQAHASMPEGARASGLLVGTAEAPGQSMSWSVPLSAGRCYAFGYAVDPSVSRFGLTVTSPSGRRLDNPRNKPHGHPLVGVQGVCAPEEGLYLLEGKVTSGAGHFAVVSYVAAGAVPSPH